MSLSVDGVWKAGVWAQTVWADGVWFEGGGGAPAGQPGALYMAPGQRRRKWEEKRREWLARLQAEFAVNHPGESTLPAQIVAQVALRQVADLRGDAQSHFEEITREFEARNIDWDGEYLKLLNLERSRLIEMEIAELMAVKRSEDEAMLLILLAAHLT